MNELEERVKRLEEQVESLSEEIAEHAHWFEEDYKAKAEATSRHAGSAAGREPRRFEMRKGRPRPAPLAPTDLPDQCQMNPGGGTTR